METKIKLNRLTLTNFKGFAKADKFFSDREEIAAENGQGKTTLRDAWFWLLGFNVNDVIPCKDNKEIPNLEIKVEAEISITTSTGEFTYNLTRVQKELRKTNKDTGIEEKVNNESTYFIDGVPFILKTYKDKIAELFCVPYEKLQMLCVKEYFNTDNGEKWKWAHRRKELFDICHVDTVLAEMTSKECYSLIAPDLAKRLSTTDIKKAIKRELSGYATEKERNAVLIADKQNEMAKYGSYDFAALEEEKAYLETKLTQLTLQAAKGDSNSNEELNTLQQQKSELQTKLFSLRAAVAHDKSDLDTKITFVLGEMRKIQTKGEQLKQEMQAAKTLVQKLEAENDKLEISTWSGSTVCPTCGQPIPQDRIEASRAAFEKDRTERIAANSKTIDEQIDYLSGAKTALTELRDTYATLSSQCDAYKAELAEKSKPNKEIADLSEQIAKIEELIKGITAEERKETDISDIIAPIKQRISELTTLISYKKIVADFAARVEQLKALNRDITDKEMLAKTKVKQIDDYVREQVKLVTDVVNSKFGNGVSFSLFSELYAGSEHDIKEECVCMLHGKTYSEMSYGERYYADLVVTEALQTEYGVNLPIFLDNAECYTGEVKSDRQLIMLYAKKGVFLDGVKIEVIL